MFRFERWEFWHQVAQPGGVSAHVVCVWCTDAEQQSLIKQTAEWTKTDPGRCHQPGGRQDDIIGVQWRQH